jgi:hypothetical protein
MTSLLHQHLDAYSHSDINVNTADSNHHDK